MKKGILNNSIFFLLIMFLNTTISMYSQEAKIRIIKCFPSAKFGQMRAFLKLQIICDNLKRGGMHDKREKVQDFA